MRKAGNLPPSCTVVTKSGYLNFLEPSGLVQVCNGIALPLPLQIIGMKFHCTALDGVQTQDSFEIFAVTVNIYIYIYIYIQKFKAEGTQKMLVSSN